MSFSTHRHTFQVCLRAELTMQATSTSANTNYYDIYGCITCTYWHYINQFWVCFECAMLALSFRAVMYRVFMR